MSGHSINCSQQLKINYMLSSWWSVLQNQTQNFALKSNNFKFTTILHKQGIIYITLIKPVLWRIRFKNILYLLVESYSTGPMLSWKAPVRLPFFSLGGSVECAVELLFLPCSLFCLAAIISVIIRKMKLKQFTTTETSQNGVNSS